MDHLNTDICISKPSSIKRLFKRRYWAAFLGFLCTFMLHALRINLSIAMVAMVNDTSSRTPETDDSNKTMECPKALYNATQSLPHRGVFQWSPQLQGYIQSAGYIGQIITQIPGGIWAGKFGAKKVLVCGFFVTALSNLLSPLAANVHPFAFIAVTLLRGMAQGLKPPSLSVLAAKWFPRDERAFLSAVIYCGFSMGALTTGYICGILCDLHFLRGWSLVFYAYGSVSILMALVFLLLFYEKPEDDPWISKDELNHIQKKEIKADNNNLSTPWFPMVTSLRINILALAMFGQYWMLFYLLSVHPTYLGTILHVSVRKNGALSGLPFTAALVAGWFTCYFSLWIISHRKASITTLRTGLNSVSCLVFVFGMIGLYFSECDILLNEVFLYVTASSNGFISGGSSITAPDMSPTFSGPLMGYVSTLASFSGFAATVMVGELTNDEETLKQWKKIFLVAGSVPFITGLLYQFFGSAEIEPWDPAFEKTTQKEKENGTRSPEITRF